MFKKLFNIAMVSFIAAMINTPFAADTGSSASRPSISAGYYFDECSYRSRSMTINKNPENREQDEFELDMIVIRKLSELFQGKQIPSKLRLRASDDLERVSPYAALEKQMKKDIHVTVTKCYTDFYKSYISQARLNAESIKKMTKRLEKNINLWSKTAIERVQKGNTIEWVLTSPIRETFSSTNFRHVVILSIDANKYKADIEMQMKYADDDDRKLCWRGVYQETYEGLKTPLKTLINECSVM